MGSNELASQSQGIRDIPDDLVTALLRLASLDHVYSFSLPFRDHTLWKGLLAAQVERAKSVNRRPILAMTLVATGGPVPGVKHGACRLDVEFGCELHVSANDDLHAADVFAYEDGSGLDPDHAKLADNLSHAVFANWYRERSNFCKHFLTRDKNCGEIKGATRREIGDWVLYSAVNPYYLDDLRVPLHWNNGYIDPDSKLGIYGHV